MTSLLYNIITIKQHYRYGLITSSHFQILIVSKHH